MREKEEEPAGPLQRRGRGGQAKVDEASSPAQPVEIWARIGGVPRQIVFISIPPGDRRSFRCAWLSIRRPRADRRLQPPSPRLTAGCTAGCSFSAAMPLCLDADAPVGVWHLAAGAGRGHRHQAVAFLLSYCA
jgi:hypothetical protein